MTKVVIQKLSKTEAEAAEVLVGECTKAILRLLKSRRMQAKVGTLRESSFIQMIALGAVFAAVVDKYPLEVQDDIERLALELADILRDPE